MNKTWHKWTEEREMHPVMKNKDIKQLIRDNAPEEEDDSSYFEGIAGLFKGLDREISELLKANQVTSKYNNGEF